MPSHLEFMVLMEREGTPLLGEKGKGPEGSIVLSYRKGAKQ